VSKLPRFSSIIYTTDVREKKKVLNSKQPLGNAPPVERIDKKMKPQSSKKRKIIFKRKNVPTQESNHELFM
jgi:hypothetical protein